MLGAFGGPVDPGAAAAVGVILIGTLIVLLTFESARWGKVAWWSAIAAFLLGLPLLALGLLALALVCLVGGPVVLAILTWIQPGLALRYLHWEEYGRPSMPLAAKDVDAERIRFTTFAAVAALIGGIAVAIGGWPERVAGTAQPAADKASTAGTPEAALVSRGRELYTRFGCAACHGQEGAGTPAGPALRGKFGAPERLADGSTVGFDEAYVQESILQPDAKIVQGYAPGVMAAGVAPNMPQLQRPENLDALIAYIKSLK